MTQIESELEMFAPIGQFLTSFFGLDTPVVEGGIAATKGVQFLAIDSYLLGSWLS